MALECVESLSAIGKSRSQNFSSISNFQHDKSRLSPNFSISISRRASTTIAS